MTVLFMHNEGYSTMCGHGIIAITTGLIEEGLFPATEPVTTIRYEVPAGIVAANAATVQLDDGSWAVRGVRFTNVPAYLAAQSLVGAAGRRRSCTASAAQYGALGSRPGLRRCLLRHRQRGELGLRVVPEQAEAAPPRRRGDHRRAAARPHAGCIRPTRHLGFVYGTIIVDIDPRTSPDGRATRRAPPQRDRLRRGGGRPLAVRLRHERAARPAPRARPDARRPGDRQRRHHRRALPGPDRGRDGARPVRAPSARASPAPPT